MNTFQRVESMGSRELLWAIFILAIALRVLFFAGFQNGDDTAYITQAFQYSQGDFTAPDRHWGARLFPVALTALSYAVFGVSDFSTTLFTFLASLCSVYLAFRLGEALFDRSSGLMAAFLVAVLPLEVLFASQLFPYAFLSALSALILFLFVKAEDTGDWRYLVACGLVLGIAYLTRITSLYIGLFFLLYAAYRWNGIVRKYALIGAGFVPVVLLESVIGYLQSGNFLQRLDAIRFVSNAKEQASAMRRAAREAANAGSEQAQSAAEVVAAGTARSDGSFLSSIDVQWLLEPFIRPVFEQEIGPIFILILLTIAIRLFAKKTPAIVILLLWIVPLFLYINYGTTAPDDYRALRRLPRYLSLVIVPSLVLLAHQLLLLRYKALRNLLLLGIFGISLLALYVDNSRYVVAREQAVANEVRLNSDSPFIVQRSLLFGTMYYNQMQVPDNVTLFVNEIDLSNGYARILRLEPDIEAVSDLAEVKLCEVRLITKGTYISQEMLDNAGYQAVKEYEEIERAYSKLLESPFVKGILGGTRDKKRIKDIGKARDKRVLLNQRACDE